MGKKSSAELTLSFLLIAALCLEAFVIQLRVYHPAESMNWTDARQYCQKNHLDLVTFDLVNSLKLSHFLKEISVEQVWIGLLRDPENDSVWKWINLKSGEGISGNNLSKNSEWAGGQPHRHCALVESDFRWYSHKCSRDYNFYCSENNTVLYHTSSSSWYKAAELCRGHNSGYLATINNTEPGVFEGSGWIGLHREGGNTWRWTGDHQSDYRNWAPREPLTEDCGSFEADTEKWHTDMCSERHDFVCYDDNLVVVNENKTWEEALEHCRSLETPCVDTITPCTHQHDLLSLDHFSDYDYIRDRIYRATTDEV